MTPRIGTLLCWNVGDGAAAMAWRAAAHDARIVTLDELGAACRIAVRLAGAEASTSLLPPDLSYVRHDGDARRLADALSRLLSGARAARVLSVDSLGSAPLLRAAIEAVQPDVIATPASLRWPLPGRAWAMPALDLVISCAEPLRPAVTEWLRPARPQPRRHRAEQLVWFGTIAGDPHGTGPRPRLMPGRRATTVLPGFEAATARLVLRFAQPLGGANVWLGANGLDTAAACDGDRATACVPAGPRLVLDILHDAAGDLDLLSVDVAPG